MLAIIFFLSLIGYIPAAQEPVTEFEIYDPTTVITFPGRVLEIKQVMSPYHKHYGQFARMQTDYGEMKVYLGPSWFLKKQKIKISVGEQLEITGSKIYYNGEPLVMAAEIRKEGWILRLRNKYNGTPFWEQI